MKHLLEQWATIEPLLCRKNTCPNPFLNPGEIERFDISTPYSWQTVYSHNNYYPDEYRSLMSVQWAVQQAIIEKGYDLTMEYIPEFGYRAKVGLYQSGSDTNIAEALLTAYLEAMDAQTKES